MTGADDRKKWAAAAVRKWDGGDVGDLVLSILEEVGDDVKPLMDSLAQRHREQREFLAEEYWRGQDEA